MGSLILEQHQHIVQAMRLLAIAIAVTALLIVVTATLAILGQWVSWVVPRVRRRLPPGPLPLPVVGNLLHLFVSPLPHRTLAKLAQHYGPLLFLQLGPTPTIVVSSPALARQIFHTHDKAFAGRPSSEVTKRLFYGGDQAAFTSSYGPEWSFVRKLYTSHVLGSRHTRQLHFPVIVTEVGILLHHLHSSPGAPVNLSACFAALLENVICRIIFRLRASNFISKAFCGGGQQQLFNLAGLIQDGACLFGSGLIGDFIPILGFLDYKRKTAMNRWVSSFDAILEAVLSKRLAQTISSKSSSSSSGEGEPKDILDVFLVSDPPLSRVKIKAMMLELLMGGIGSSAVTLDWAMAELLSNPRVLRKVREEVDRVVGKERMVDMADLPSLHITKAVVKETLRMHPPSPLLLPRISIEACELQVEGDDGQGQGQGQGHGEKGGSYKIPAGTRMFVNAWAIGHDPVTWDEPEKFMPERFVAGKGADIDMRGQHFELVPFGSGRRICPAIGLASALMELTVASLVHCFEWAIHEEANVDMTEKYGMVMPRQDPLVVVPIRFRLDRFLGPTELE